MSRVRTLGKVRFAGLAAVLVLGTGVLTGCGSSGGDEAGTDPATVESVDGSEVSRIVLTDEAVKRLDLQTAKVEAGPTGGMQIPYSAVLYDPVGAAWAFTNTEPLAFQRASITIDHIDGDVAYLTDGPAVGTEVVTLGSTELYGAEIGVGDE